MAIAVIFASNLLAQNLVQNNGSFAGKRALGQRGKRQMKTGSIFTRKPD